jgi:uncharacterized protein
MYAFKIQSAAAGQFRVQFLYNSEILVWSENYTTKQAAIDAIASIKANAPSARIVDLTIGESGTDYRFEIDHHLFNQFMVRFRASNGEIMVRSEAYTAKHNAKNCAESVRANCATALLIDETLSRVA